MEFIADAASGMIDLGDDEETTAEEDTLDKTKGLTNSIRDSHVDARHGLRCIYDG
jgi:hypothetical protein